MYALVDANSFYASCERVFRPELAGRPVVVLSNNDGCIIARSKEAKAAGFEMGEPYFKCRDKIRQHRVAVFSSNYTLYDDMSRRVQHVLGTFAEEMEVYSTDESFLRWTNAARWPELGREILEAVYQFTGLPVGVGIAPSKTLAKLANKLAKKGNGVRVLDTPEAVDEALGGVELGDLWGVSIGTVRRLAMMGIRTPRELRDADAQQVQTRLGVVGQRLVYELRGDPCIELETETADKKNICVSRSFGTVATSEAELREAVSTFAAQAGVKMRRQDLATAYVVAFVETDRHAPVEQYAGSWGVRLAAATGDSRELSTAALWCLGHIYRREHRYKKAGVFMLDLCKRERAQRGLFTRRDPERAHELMTLMDQINKRHGRGTLRLASTSPFTLAPCRTWHLRSDFRSPSYTTRWAEIPVATAVADA